MTNNKGKLEFTPTKQEEERKAAAFKVTLGVMPDYVFEGPGMRIDGVLSNKPAEKAGLLDGDIIVEMGGMKVKDIYDYMKALGQYDNGDEAEVVVLRKKEKVKAKVKF